MAYGHSDANRLSGSPYSHPLQNQVPEHLSVPNDPEVTSSRFNSRTVVETCHYQCQLSGNWQRFDTFEALLSNAELWSEFKNKISFYYPEFDISLDDRTIKQIVVNDGYLRQCYLLINNIDKIHFVPPSETIVPINDRIAAIPSTDNSRSDESASLCHDPYNCDMVRYTDRCLTFISDGFRDYCNNFLFTSVPRVPSGSRDFKNALQLADAGFYFSFAENTDKKVQCFSCGGVMQSDLVAHSDNILQMHGKFYPKCNYLLNRKKQEFINDCQDQLTTIEKSLVAQPLPDIPGLYQRPVSEGLRHRDRIEQQRDVDDRAIREGLSEVSRAKPERIRIRLNLHMSIVCDTFIDNLQGKISVEQLEALQKLNRKIQVSPFAREKTLQQSQSFAYILQSLLDYPESLLNRISEEITVMIHAAEKKDCQVDTSEVIDQIKTRMLFVALKQELSSETGPFSLFQALCKLKLFFNESVLFKRLIDICFNDWTTLIAFWKFTEIRGYVKNVLAQTVCDFPENHITQRFGYIDLFPAEVMEIFKHQFLENINNVADFINYLKGLFKSDNQFLDYIKQLDHDFPTWRSKTEINAEFLMENLDSDLVGAQERELLEGASNEQWMAEDIDQFVSEAVRRNWDGIIGATST